MEALIPDSLSNPTTPTTPDLPNLEGKFLTFNLNQEEYGIDILQIREIIGLMPVTSVPHAPAYLRGVINLRGKVIPVLDLRRRFGLGEIEATERTCIIVVELGTIGGGKRVMGLVVDSVSEVLQIKGDDIEPAPSFGARVETGFIRGMAKMAGRVKILLDIDRILDHDEISSMLTSVH